MQLWVQVWNLPNHWLFNATGFKFEKIFGEVTDVLFQRVDLKKVDI